MTDLERALALAVERHAGQKDKAGDPYILHVLGVWRNVSEAGYGETHQIVALLHDVVEDTDTTVADITAAFGPEIGAAVDAMSRRPGESYDAYLERVKQDPIAPAVKLADSRDNFSRLPRLKDPAERERHARKYRKVFDAFARGGEPRT